MSAPDSGPLADSDWRLLTRMAPYVRPYAGWYVAALLLAPASAVVSVGQPYLLKVAIDEHILVGDVAGTQWIALQYLGLVVGAWVLDAGYFMMLSVGAMGTIATLRGALYRHTLGLGRSFFDTQPKGRLLTRVTSDIEALGETLTAGAVTILLDVLKVVGILAAMAWLDWRLTLVMLVMAPVIAAVVESIRRVLRRLYHEVRTSLSELNAFTAERLNGLEVVQLYNDEQRANAMFAERVDRYRRATIQTNVLDATLYAVMDGLTSVTMALMLWYGAGGLAGVLGLAAEGQTLITAGVLAAFIEYVGRLYQPIQEFSAKVAILQRATSALEKIFGLLGVQERVSPGSVDLAEGAGDVEIEELRFAYGDGPDVLKGVDLRIAPGEVVAVVGRTGSGKTTLGRVLTRAYDGYRGSVRVEGVELSEVRPSSVRRIIGSVLQDVQLFPGTVRFNLTLGRDLDDERILAAVEAARAAEVVASLGGLDGRVSHKGGNVSVGEAQLLSFARTLLVDPPVVILDEATANVDSLTEAKLQEATRVLLETKTVLVIAHRLSTVVGADRIAVMEAGRVVELGSHAELMAADGRYAALFRQQFGDNEDASAAAPTG